MDGVGSDLCPIQRDVAQAHQSRLLAQLEHLHEVYSLLTRMCDPSRRVEPLAGRLRRRGPGSPTFQRLSNQVSHNVRQGPRWYQRRPRRRKPHQVECFCHAAVEPPRSLIGFSISPVCIWTCSHTPRYWRLSEDEGLGLSTNSLPPQRLSGRSRKVYRPWQFEHTEQL